LQRALDDVCRRFPSFGPDCLFLDALIWPEQSSTLPQLTLVDGDSRSLSVAAASVLAKTWRDAHMESLDRELPVYGFGAHKGYGTTQHRAALAVHGPCLFHRLSYAPVRKILGG
jgi:ribonuclease HII